MNIVSAYAYIIDFSIIANNGYPEATAKMPIKFKSSNSISALFHSTNNKIMTKKTIHEKIGKILIEN